MSEITTARALVGEWLLLRGYSFFTEEGSFVENTDPPTGDCRDYVILRMPSHFKSASYQFKHRKWGIKGAEPLDLSNLEALTNVQLKRRRDFLRKKLRAEEHIKNLSLVERKKRCARSRES